MGQGSTVAVHVVGQVVRGGSLPTLPVCPTWWHSIRITQEGLGNYGDFSLVALALHPWFTNSCLTLSISVGITNEKTRSH